MEYDQTWKGACCYLSALYVLTDQDQLHFMELKSATAEEIIFGFLMHAHVLISPELLFSVCRIHPFFFSLREEEEDKSYMQV